MMSPVVSESPAPPAPFSDASVLKGELERPSPAPPDPLTYQTSTCAIVTLTVPALCRAPSVTWYVNVSTWFLSPTPGRKVKLPSAAIVAEPPPVEVTVSATADTVCGDRKSVV